MTPIEQADDRTKVDAKPRKAWVTPQLQKIRAGDAERGTRAAADGAFTTS